jgi:phosphoadenosine phosphosulfate reductase
MLIKREQLLLDLHKLISQYEKPSIIFSSSFGINSIVGIHLINSFSKELKIVFIDTGFLYKETYEYYETIKNKYNLNIDIVKSNIKACCYEKKHGQIWTTPNGHKKYNDDRKIIPFKKYIKKNNIKIWITSLHHDEAQKRKNIKFVEIRYNILKFNPFNQWTNRDFYHYKKDYDLVEHPLYEKGYERVGDYHSTLEPQDYSKNNDYYFSNFRECGLNV